MVIRVDAPNLIAVVAGLLVAPILVVVTVVVFFRRRDRFTARALPATAMITGIRRGIDPSCGMVFFARVDFRTADGRPVTTEIRLYGTGTQPRIGIGTPPLRVGQALPLRYDPGNPARAEAAA